MYHAKFDLSDEDFDKARACLDSLTEEISKSIWIDVEEYDELDVAFFIDVAHIDGFVNMIS